MTQRDVVTSAEALMLYHQEFAAVFERCEQRQWSLVYMCGQLSNLGRKTIEPLVLSLYGEDANAIRGLQHFLGQGGWEASAMLRRCQQLAGAWLGEDDGVVIVDGSGFPKQGAHSAGVARQYCGALGKVANCQEGVFAAYVSRSGYTLLDARLYMHRTWFADDHRERWQACGIPEGLSFATEPALALEMMAALVEHAEVPFRWVTGDEHFGQNPGFLDGVAALGKWYLAEVPADTRVWQRRPRVEPPGCGPLGRPRTHPRLARTAAVPQSVRDLSTALPSGSWKRRRIKEGAKGTLLAEFAFLRGGLPGTRSWLVLRRSLARPPEIKFYLSNAPTTCPTNELVRVSGLRWPIETALEEGKGEVGMDRYETRTWLGWHHHMAHSFMAQLFLTHLRLLFEKSARLSPSLKPVNWLPKPSRMMSSPLTSLPPSPTPNDATMPLIAHTAHVPRPVIAPHANRAKSRSKAMSRCSIRWSRYYGRAIARWI